MLPTKNQTDFTNYFSSVSEDAGGSLVNSVDPVRSQQRCFEADAPAGEEGGGLSQQQAGLG